MKPKIPIYDGINIQISGYDYSILESFQKLIYNISKNMDINVEDCWALPHVDMQISTYKPLSEILQTQYNLKIYKRVVYITEISTTQVTKNVSYLLLEIKFEYVASYFDESY